MARDDDDAPKTIIAHAVGQDLSLLSVDELTARGISVILLEAGKRFETHEFLQDEGKAFGQLSWLDPREATGDWLAAKIQPNAPTWTCKAVGGSTLHWNGFAGSSGALNEGSDISPAFAV